MLRATKYRPAHVRCLIENELHGAHLRFSPCEPHSSVQMRIPLYHISKVSARFTGRDVELETMHLDTRHRTGGTCNQHWRVRSWRPLCVCTACTTSAFGPTAATAILSATLTAAESIGLGPSMQTRQRSRRLNPLLPLLVHTTCVEGSVPILRMQRVRLLQAASRDAPSCTAVTQLCRHP